MTSKSRHFFQGMKRVKILNVTIDNFLNYRVKIKYFWQIALIKIVGDL